MPDLRLSLNPSPSLLAQARAAAVEGRFEAAAGLAERVLSDGAPSCLLALRILAWAQLELGDPRAVATFQRCASLDPEDALAEVGQAIWYQRHQQRDEAIQHWVRAWELDPYSQAIRRALVRLTGELPESALADGVGLLRVGRYEEAVEVLRQLHATHAADPVVRLGLIAGLRALGARREATELAVSLPSVAPACIQGLLLAAAVEEAEGRTLRARDLLARAEHADPGLELFGELARELALTPATPDLARASRSALALAG